MVGPAHKPDSVNGGILVLSYLGFFLLSMLFLTDRTFEEAIQGYSVILVMGVNYLPLIIVPYLFSLKTRSGISFLGLSASSFKKTLPYSIIALILGGVWQCGIFPIKDITSYPEWSKYIYYVVVPVIAILIPLIEIRLYDKTKIIPGLLTLLSWGLFHYFYPTGDESLTESLIQASSKFTNFLLISFQIGIFAPFAEEYFFRGFVLNYYQKNMTVYPAALLTALLFGLAHLGSPVVLTLVLFAIPLGLLTGYSRSIYPAIFAHVGLNLSGMILVKLSTSI